MTLLRVHLARLLLRVARLFAEGIAPELRGKDGSNARGNVCHAWHAFGPAALVAGLFHAKFSSAVPMRTKRN